MKTYTLRKDLWNKYMERVSVNCTELRNGVAGFARYIDPDKGIIEEKKILGRKIKIAPDGICGIKYLQKYCDDYAGTYQIIRSKLITWPSHSNGINQRRYQVFRDRLDFTIYDIKQFYIDGKGNSKLVIKNSDTAYYLNVIGSFRDFINEYELQNFVDKSNNVINLATGKIIKSYDEYTFSKEINRKYLDGLIRKLKVKNT